jgi:hypothetical protein
MALEGIEAALERTAIATEKGLEANLEFMAEQREQRERAEAAQRQFAAQFGILTPGQPGGRIS